MADLTTYYLLLTTYYLLLTTYYLLLTTYYLPTKVRVAGATYPVGLAACAVLLLGGK